VGFGFLSLWILHICLGITRGVLCCGLAIDIKKYLKAKEELRKLKYSKKKPLKETKILQDIITLVTNLKFQHKPKYHLSKILI
jgi:hypothetical protein